MEEAQKKLEIIKRKIKIAAEKSGRNSSEIKILGVTKTVSVDVISLFYKAGLTLFGENYVQEFLPKYEVLHNTCPKIDFHFIGNLQSNKVKFIIDKVSLIHGVEKESVISEISKRAKAIDKTQDILLQVNISNEASKSGANYDFVNILIDKTLTYENVKLKGFMCIPSPEISDDELQKEYSKMRVLLEDMNKKFSLQMNELSMGMSHDYELAIQEGATIVRLGTILFGERYYVL